MMKLGGNPGVGYSDTCTPPGQRPAGQLAGQRWWLPSFVQTGHGVYQMPAAPQFYGAPSLPYLAPRAQHAVPTVDALAPMTAHRAAGAATDAGPALRWLRQTCESWLAMSTAQRAEAVRLIAPGKPASWAIILKAMNEHCNRAAGSVVLPPVHRPARLR